MYENDKSEHYDDRKTGRQTDSGVERGRELERARVFG